ncbi:hypothetical protein [Aeromonas jandaei]|uniref:hypothetical protein n=1 Tax=Aeromonas jandaei TaxID=650 RepID=UPI00398627D8
MTYFLGMSVDWSLIALFAGMVCAFLLLIFSLVSARRESRNNKLKEAITESITPPKKTALWEKEKNAVKK